MVIQILIFIIVFYNEITFLYEVSFFINLSKVILGSSFILQFSTKFGDRRDF